MSMEEYVGKNYNRLMNDFKVVKELPLNKSIPDWMHETTFSDYNSDRYKSEILYKETTK